MYFLKSKIICIFTLPHMDQLLFKVTQLESVWQTNVTSIEIWQDNKSLVEISMGGCLQGENMLSG